jgi:hypothetical protein
VRLAGALAVPRVDRGLEPVAFGEQLAVAWRQLIHDGAQAVPELLATDAGARQRLAVHEVHQLLVDP